MTERINWDIANIEAQSMLADVEDSLYDPRVKRAVEELVQLSEEIGQLPRQEWAGFLAQFEEEYLSSYMGQQVLVTGEVTEYDGELIGGYVQELTPGVSSELVWCADRQMTFNGCMIEQKGDEVSVVLSGVDEKVPDEHGMIRAMTYGIPLDTLLVFPGVYSPERRHATLHSLMPNLMSKLDEILIGQEHAEASSVLAPLKDLSLDDLVRFNHVSDLEQAISHLNVYLGEMVKFDQYMGYEVEFAGLCYINDQWYEANLPGVLMAGKMLGMVAQSTPDNPETIYLRLVVGAVMLDPDYRDQTYVLLPLDAIGRFDSVRAKIIQAPPNKN